MTYFNILYEDDKDDVDIICVPHFIANKMTILAQDFLDWLPNAGEDIYWTVLDGRKVSVCETDGFVQWLNENYCRDTQKVFIVNQHVQFCDELGTVEF